MCHTKQLISTTSLLFLMIVTKSFSQGPRLSYLYNPTTEFSWASCYVYLDGGSRQKIPFLPMINNNRSPFGTNKYTQDIHINRPVVFVGNGIVKENEFDCYAELDVSDKIVMFCYDFPDTNNSGLEKEVKKETRIAEAISRGAAAMIVFSYQKEFPFLKYLDNTAFENIPEVPIISIQKDAAVNILASGGRDAADIFRKWQDSGKFKSEELICKLQLDIKGKFDRLETDNFLFSFRKELILEDKMKELVDINEKSVRFILDLFKSEKLEWEKSFVAYFRDYDSKLFYTGHWGKGLSSGAGSFLIYDGNVPNFGLAVHENTHTLIYSNWSGSTSFMNEGIAKYAEAMAINEDANHIETINHLRTEKLVPLEQMIKMNIGSDKATEIAYPAAGSFIGYLITTYGLGKIRTTYDLESQKEKSNKDTWQTAYQKSLRTLEKNWLYWLVERYQVERRYVDRFFEK